MHISGKAGRLIRTLIRIDNEGNKGCESTLSPSRCPAYAGLIRSAAYPPYGELTSYARARVYRRAATSGPPNKTLDRPLLRLLKSLRLLLGLHRRSAHRYAQECNRKLNR